MAKILIVEDDQRLNELICRNLKLVGHSCDSYHNGLEVWDRLPELKVDLMILDVMLPGANGYEIMEELRNTRRTDIPVIFLTARAELRDRLKGLRLGADDYIIKPFEMLELQERINAVLRRTNKAEQIFCIGRIRVDFAARSVWKDGTAVECAPKEFDLLEILIANRNIALSRDKILELVWGYEYAGDTRTVDVHIQRIRKKLDLEDHIKTVYKMGYRMEMKHEG